MLQCFVGRRPAPGASRFALGIKNTYGCMIPGMTVYISSKTLLDIFFVPFSKGKMQLGGTTIQTMESKLFIDVFEQWFLFPHHSFRDQIHDSEDTSSPTDQPMFILTILLQPPLGSAADLFISLGKLIYINIPSENLHALFGCQVTSYNPCPSTSTSLKTY